MNGEPVVRKWVTILNADVVGYSQMTASDEVGAMDALVRARHWLAATIEGFGGRVIDATGDNLMAEFALEAAAVSCALHIQRTLRGGSCEPEIALRFRIGLHSGSVLCHGAHRYGNVVNIAARLQCLAAVGGVLVSEATSQRAPAAVRACLGDHARFECRNIPGLIGASRDQL